MPRPPKKRPRHVDQTYENVMFLFLNCCERFGIRHGRGRMSRWKIYLRRVTMHSLVAKWTVPAVLAGLLLAGGQIAHAGGYYYQARSLYVMPPMYAYQPVFGPQPIVVYEPVVTYPAPVAGYVVPTAATVPVAVPVQTQVVQYAAPAPAGSYSAPAVPVGVGVGVGRVTERQLVTPNYNQYRYHVHNAYGPDYTYRVRDNGRVVRFNERWSR